MLNIQVAESLINIITFLVAYTISVTLCGCFAAWIALHMGDEGPAEHGFLSFNPLIHVDLLGTLFIFLYGFGWSRYIPINPANIQGKFRSIKIFTALLAEPIAYIILGLISLIALVGLFDQQVSVQSLMHGYSESSSYRLAIGFILISMIRVTVMLAIITFLVNISGLAITTIIEKYYPHYMIYSSLIMVIVPVVIFYIFKSLLFSLLFNFIKSTAFLLASLLHLF